MLWGIADHGLQERVLVGTLKSLATETYGFLQIMGYHTSVYVLGQS
jgi:hypothetical protein